MVQLPAKQRSAQLRKKEKLVGDDALDDLVDEEFKQN